MILATKIKMKPGCDSYNNLLEIDEIYLEGPFENGYYSKADVYDLIFDYKKEIRVNMFPTYPILQSKISKNGEKYVSSTPNDTDSDNLLKLPRE